MESAERVGLSSEGRDDLSGLTEQEREILRLVFDGNCSQEAAEALGISKRTVDFHLARAYVKLGVTNRFQAYKRAAELGIIEA